MAQQLNSNLLNLRCLLCNVVRAVMPVRCMESLLRKVPYCLHTPACQQAPWMFAHYCETSVKVWSVPSGLLWPTAAV